LNARGDRLDAVREIVADARSRGFEFLPVDVNHSAWEHTVEADTVRVGFQLVRGFTAPAAERLERERSRRPFESLDDLRRRVPGLGSVALESLAKAGGLATLGLDLDAALDEIAAQAPAPGAGTQLELGLASGAAVPPRVLQLSQRIQLETEALGVALHSDPLLQRASTWGRLALQRSTQLAEFLPGLEVRVGGRVRRVNETRTRQGEKMAFLELEDPWGTFEVVVFPGAFERMPREALHAGGVESLVAVAGKLEHDAEMLRVVADRVEILRTDDVARVVNLAERVAGGSAGAVGAQSAAPLPASHPAPGERRVS
jgi:DNA polymerase III alpha subunit